MSIQEWYESPTQDTQLGDTAESAMAGTMDDITPRPKTDFQKWATGEQGEGRLKTSMEQARKENPDLRAEVFQLQGKTGLPAELIQRNLDIVRERVAASDFDPKRFRQDFPKLAGAMEDPETSALAHDDLDSLQLLERTLSGFQGLDERELRFQVEGRTGRRPGDFGLDPRQLQDALNAEEIDLAEFQERFPRFSTALANNGESPESLQRRDAAFASLERTNESERFRTMGTLDWFLEAPAANYRKGLMGEELNDLYFQQMSSGSSPEQQARIAELEQQLGQMPEVDGRGTFTDMVAAASEIAPSLVGGVQAGAETGIPAGMGAGATAFALGQAGPQVATPEELFTVPAATLTGLSVGGATGFAQYAYRQETGAAFAEFSAFRDEEGNPIDRDTAAVAAAITGGIGAGLESLGFGQIVKTFPGGEKILGAFSRDTMKQALRNPTVRKAFGDLAKRYGTAWGTETMTEVMQEGVAIIGGELAKAWDPGDFEGITAEEAQARLTETFTLAAQGMALLSAPGPVSSFAMDYGRARRSRQTSEAMEALGEGARASKLRERLPSKYREVVAKLREDGPIQNVQIPVERWNELFQGQQLDPAEVANEVTGSYDGYAEAMATGGDVVIPVEAYAEKLAGGEFHDFLAQNSRFRPGDMTAREAQEWLDSAPEQVANYLGESAQPDPSVAVYDDVFGQLIGAGRDRSAADQEARLTQSVFRTLGERLGMDPAELFQQYNISVTRPMPEVLRRAGGNLDTDLDPIIDRLRAGDIPTQRDAFGPSLMDFLRDRGVRDDGGELAARDVDTNRLAFQRAISREDGMTPDDAAQAAAEAGYLAGMDRDNVTADDLMQAIDREMRDGPVFSTLDGDTQVQQLRETLEQLGDYLEELGVDIDAMDNEAIKQALRGEQAQPTTDGEAATTLNQFAGQRARTADTLALETAQERIAAGEDPETVRQDTGWFQGDDGQWRFEISDDQAALLPTIETLAQGAREAASIDRFEYTAHDDGTYTVSLYPEGVDNTRDIVNLVRVRREVLEAMLPGDAIQAIDQDRGVDEWQGLLEGAGKMVRDAPFDFGGFNALPLEQVLDHPRLFIAYPQLRNLLVQVDPSMGIGAAFLVRSDGTMAAIRIGRAQQLSGLLHEIQHGIQNIEGFARGGSASQFTSRNITQERVEDISQQINELLNENPEFGNLVRRRNRELSNVRDQYGETTERGQRLDWESVPEDQRNSYFELLDQIEAFPEGARLYALEAERNNVERSQPVLSAEEQYRRLAGEIEARNVQARQRMTDSERREASPEQTRDVPADQAIVVMNGEELQEAPANAPMSAAQLSQELRDDFPGLKLYMRERGNVATIDRIEVPEDQRESGIGSQAMQRITDWADANGKTLALTPSADFGGSKRRLGPFYKRFGFVNNKGPGRDQAISESMLREPGQSLDQGGRQPRGRISFPQSRRFFNIELLERADLSTFLHESGHLYLEVLRELAQREGVPQQIRDDFQTILDWLGVEDADSIGTEQHEQWARGFEAYLMEGNAPSAELRDVFARFKAWLVAIYRNIRQLDVELTDEVRGVMDRLVATDEEISAARDEAGYRPLFNDAQAAGMTEAEYQAYRESAEQARNEAEDSLTRRVMREFQRETKAWWREAKAQVREEVAGEVNQRPEYVAMAVMGRGKLPDGSAMPEGMEPFKLNRAALVERYGKAFLKRLPRPYVYSREGGIHPDMAAEMFGYRSGDEMIQAMVNARPRKQLISAEVDARMNERYGDMLNDGSMADAAMESVHNDKRAEVMQRELRALASRSRRPASPMSAIKAAAQRIVAEKQVRNLRPDLYLRAEQKASREAFNALAEGDYAAATEAKQKQLLNHELYREARNARQEIDKLVDYAARLGRKATRQRLAKAGADYLAQIDSLLERYEFRRATSLRRIDRRQSLDAWIAEQNEQGFTVDVPESVANDARVINYKQVSVEELRGIRDALRQIEHLARTKNRLLAARDQRDFEATVDGIVSTIEASHKRVDKPVPLHDSLKDKIAGWTSQAHAWHTKPEFLFRWLDGDRETGPVWRAMFKPLADAETAEQAMQADVTKRLARIMSVYTRKERAGWYGEKYYVPAIGRSMDKATMLSIALNWGNAYNREVLMEGHGWSDSQVQAILSRLEARDWLVVQEIWDLIDSFWPDIKALEEDLNGIAPEKVAPAPVETPAGTLRGGYYPIKYDTRVSYRAFQREEKAGVEMFENSFTRPATRKGHTKERQGSGGQQLRLDMDVLSEHIGQVIHDVTHRRAVIDVNRLAQNTEVRSAIEQTAGREMYRQIRPWLQSIANETLQPESYWEKLIGQARTGATVVNMGLKVTTAIVQPLGFFNSVDLIGERYAWKGLTDFLGSRGRSVNTWTNMRRATAFVQERSVMMQNRQKTFDRDVRDSLQRLTKESRLQEWQRSFFYFTGLMDQAVVIPTWLGAYRKAMEGEVGEVDLGNERAAIDYADSIVRMSQSSGGVKDLAQIQRGGQVRRSFVMFYSYFSALYNQFSRQISRVKQGDISLPRLAASAMYLWFAPAILGELIAQRGPDDEEEWIEWAAKNMILYPLGTVVGLRDVGNAVLTPFGYDASPAFDAFSMTARTAKIPLKALDEDQEVGRSDAKAAVLTAGYWAKLPSRQAWITGEYLYDLATGEDSPESPQDFVRDLFFSRPADER